MLIQMASKTNGQKFTIPTQTFTQCTLSVSIYGQRNTLEFNYRHVVDNSSSGSHHELKYRCIATKQ
uniref:Uncharacterized protein n=1 Tax=Roseihalotalea indica TaxID=2867963 RepID=A0AA49GUG7_9BACT|nr:hypothetical protein K4G66_07590 [Tunicatimonas sp. TK19036]